MTNVTRLIERFIRLTCHWAPERQIRFWCGVALGALHSKGLDNEDIDDLIREHISKFP